MHPALNLTNLYQSYLSIKRVLRHTIWIWPKAEYNKQTLTEITKYSKGTTRLFIQQHAVAVKQMKSINNDCVLTNIAAAVIRGTTWRGHNDITMRTVLQW